MTFTIPEPAFVRDAAVGVVTDWLDGLSLEGRCILAEQLLGTAAESVGSHELAKLGGDVKDWSDRYKAATTDDILEA